MLTQILIFRLQTWQFTNIITHGLLQFHQRSSYALIYQSNDYNKNTAIIPNPMSVFRRLSCKKIANQHCIEDTACLHHCQCWELHRKQFDIKFANLLAKYQEAKKQAQFQIKLNTQMVKQLQNFKRRAAKYSSIQAMKEDFRKQLEAAIYKQREVQDELTKQKIKDMESTIAQQTSQIEQLRKLYEQSQSKLKQTQYLLKQANIKNQGLQQENQQLKQQVQKLQKKQEEYYNVILQHESTIDEKTAVIDRLRGSLNELEGRFIRQKAKAGSFQAEKDLLEVNLKNRDKYIQSLTKCSEQNLKNLHNVQSNNQGLKDLIGVLDCQVKAGRMNELYFRDRLIQSEERLAFSEGLAAYNSQKVEMMKEDLNLLRLTL